MTVLGCSCWSLMIPLVIQPVFKHILIERRVKFGFHLCGWKLTKLALKIERSLSENFSVFNFINYFARNADSVAVGKFYGAYDPGYRCWHLFSLTSYYQVYSLFLSVVR
jgi:hypothetical protein